MDISKLGALWSLMTGGWAGLAVYILEAINKWLAGLDVERLARAAAVVKAVANALEYSSTPSCPPSTAMRL